MLPVAVRQAIKRTQRIDFGTLPGDSAVRTAALDAVIEQAKIDHPECFVSDAESSVITYDFKAQIRAAKEAAIKSEGETNSAIAKAGLAAPMYQSAEA